MRKRTLAAGAVLAALLFATLGYTRYTAGPFPGSVWAFVTLDDDDDDPDQNDQEDADAEDAEEGEVDDEERDGGRTPR